MKHDDRDAASRASVSEHHKTPKSKWRKRRMAHLETIIQQLMGDAVKGRNTEPVRTNRSSDKSALKRERQRRHW